MKPVHESAKAVELNDDWIKKQRLPAAFAKGNSKEELLKNSAGGHALQALAKFPGKRSEAIAEAIRLDKSNLGPNISKDVAGLLNEQCENHPEWLLLLTPRAARKVKRDLYKKFEIYFEQMSDDCRKTGQRALVEFQSNLEKFLLLLEGHGSRASRYAQDFMREVRTFKDSPRSIDGCHEMLSALIGYFKDEDSRIVELAGRMHNNLAEVKAARDGMEKAIIFRSLYGMLRETQRNPSYRWLAARISPEMRGHLAAAFGIFGAVVMILSVPLMVGPLKDWFADLFHHHSDQQQQQGQ